MFTGLERMQNSGRFLCWWDQDINQEENYKGSIEGEERDL